MLNLSRSALIALLLALLTIGVTQAQQGAGRISGTVQSTSENFTFHGATVRLMGTDQRTSTDRSGRFNFFNLPVGEYELRIEYVGVPAKTVSVSVVEGETSELTVTLDEDLDRMLVVGQKAQQSAALSRERAAVNNINVLSADAIGQFPDANVAEALQRVAGLSLARDQGEGRFAIIRGANANFNTTTVNGLRVPGPEDDSRAVNLDVVSADLVDSVEISKSITPDQDADAVGGNIEITTLSAFELGNSLTVSAEGSYNEKLEKTSPRASLTGTRLFSVGNGFDNVAVSGSINYFDRKFAVDNVEAGDYPEFELADGGFTRIPEAAEQRDYELSRKRVGGVFNIEMRPDDRSQYYIRTLYSDFADNEIELEHEYIFDEGSPIEVTPNGALFSDAEVERRGKETTATREIFTLSVGGENEFDLWAVDYQAGYAEASTSEPFSLGTAVIASGLEIGYNFQGSGGREAPNLFGTDLEALEDLTAYELDLVELESDKTQEEELSFAINFTRELRLGNNPAQMKFGAKLRSREKFNDANNTNFVDFGGDYTLADLVGPGQRDYSLGRFGPYISTRVLRDFYFANRSDFEADPVDFLLDSEGEDYSLEEDIYSAYLMFDATVGQVDWLAGLRVESTDISQAGFRSIVNEDVNDGIPTVEPFAAENDYTDIFPNLQMLYTVNNNWQLRAAFTRTMGRPGFVDAGARQVVEIEGGDIQAEVGNPELKPFYSNNFDLELSYFSDADLGAASIGFFYKDIDDFFLETDIAGQSPFEEFDEVTAVVNGDSAEIFGVELSYVQEFVMLPAPWDGLLLIANYTWVDSEADVPFRDTSIPLPQQSDSIFNLALGYDGGPISLRLALNHRGEYFDSINDPEDPSQDEYVSAETRLDFTSEYRFTDSIKGKINVSNITDEPYYAFYGDSRFARQYDEFGRTVELGVEVRF
ncbi:MAG: TonB-dependent receptor [Wenzhouxiangella sp.]|jgi:TonB-dependent receptor|nr:TonB-dependent receptor [Wenzhouxiangella sp.]